MRSLGITSVLAVLAFLGSGLTAWQWVHGNFNAVLGEPPFRIGDRLYRDFRPEQVKHIRISQNDIAATFELTEEGWQATSPWSDRMDPRAAVEIINFTLGLRVEDAAPSDQLDLKEAGLKDGNIAVRLEGAGKQPLARYKFGRKTPWLAEVADIKDPVPTVFVQLRDPGRKGFVYACTGDITPLFRENLKFLRDHRPFYFNPMALRQIRIRNEDGELTLGRETPRSAWRLLKPLDLATDPAAIKSLVEGLYELKATKVSDRPVSADPSSATLAKSGEITLTSFGADQESTFAYTPPESAEGTVATSTITARPGTLFEIPYRPLDGLISIADLPLSVNELRDASLTNLNIQSLRGILIQPATGKDILISRTPPQPWRVTIDGQTQDANEERLFRLLKTVTEGRTTKFEDDAATDMSRWGLDRPVLKLQMLGENSQTLELNFGIDSKGEYFVNRSGNSAVMRIDGALLESIPRHPYEWRDSRLWSLNRVNLLGIERFEKSIGSILLKYEFATEKWTASQDSNEVTASINPSRANFLLDQLEELKVSRWLAPEEKSSRVALEKPTLRFKVIEKSLDENGEFKGLIEHQISLAPGAEATHPEFYYGRLDSDPNHFMIDRETYQKLATNLQEE